MAEKTAFERVAELHSALRAYCTVNGKSCHQTISDHGAYCGASNSPAHSLEFRSILAPGRIGPDSEHYTAFRQGFFAIDVHLYVVWGGRHHDETPCDTPEIQYSVANRLAGGIAPQFWSQNWTVGDPNNNHLDFDAILPLVTSLLEPQEA